MSFTRSVVSIPSLALLCLVAACKITPTDLEHWKRTQRGPEKLAAVVRSPRYEVDLRSRALASIATMDRTDVRPVDLFGSVANGLVTRHDPQATAIFEATATELETAMRGGERPSRPGDAPTEEQTNAKDAAVLLVPRLQGATRTHLVSALMGYFAADFPRRSMSGQSGAEEVARRFGSEAAVLLLPALDAKLDKDAIVKIASIVASVGDAAAKQAAGERMVAIEREMESAAYLEWVKTEVHRSMAVGGTTPNEQRVAASATLTREGLLTQGAILGMKSLSAVPVVGARLLEIARTAPPAGMNTALLALQQERRAQALAALEGGVKAEQVSTILQIALDATNTPQLREIAFDRLAESRSNAAIAPMWPLVAVTGLDGDAATQRTARALRARAAELVLQIGGAGAIGELYAHLSSAPTTPYEPGELEGYANRIAAMTPVPTRMRSDLQSPVWWQRVIALHVLGKTGSASDAALLERASSDPMPTVGAAFRSRDPSQDTVGKVAAAVLVAMRERLAQPR